MGAHQGIGSEFRNFVEQATVDKPHTMYTYAELAAALRVSVQTVEVWVKRGQIPSPVYIGHTARFTLETLTQILKGVGKPQTYPVADSPRAAAVKAALHQKKRRKKAAATARATNQAANKAAARSTSSKTKKRGAT